MSGLKPSSCQHLSVLVVEDNEVNQKVAQAMLQHFGIVPSIAENGKLALSMLEKNSYDLILMDCQMPVMDGFETTRLIRESSRESGPSLKTDSNVIIIAMTANTTSDDIDNCISCGMNDFIAKPLELEIVGKILGKWYECT